MQPSIEVWLDSFICKHQRVPRILHIGNIANNAYNNAKILNSFGVDSDVICYDYYHIMGCPEWEDADFNVTDLDHFTPDWTAVDLGGFVRPRWFAQGPQQLCIEYLIAKQTGDTQRTDILWQELNYANKTVNGGKYTGLFSSINVFISHLTCFFKRQKNRVKRLLLREDALQFAWLVLGALGKKHGDWAFIFIVLVAPVVLLAVAVLSPLRHKEFAVNNLKYKKEIERRVLQFSELFPDRTDKLSTRDLSGYDVELIASWRQLFRHYDIIQAYSTDGIYPLLAEVPYIAFEHGTIRDIPYAETSQGRLTALTYRCANHVFVTNFDCKQSADFLAPDKYSLINHPYDEDHGLTVSGWEELRLELNTILESEFLFFFPTRQDWVSGTGYADKDNDVFLKAFCRLRAAGYSVGLVCCSWGANISESKELLKKLGCERYVKWVEPMAIVPFERMAKACGCVVDQFKLGAFGGVLFKAMSVGVPVLTYLDEQRLKEQYEEVPPVINCRTEVEIAECMRELIDNPEILIAKGQESRAWIKKYHGKSETVNAQVNQYRLLMSA